MKDRELGSTPDFSHQTTGTRKPLHFSFLLSPVVEEEVWKARCRGLGTGCESRDEVLLLYLEGWLGFRGQG